MCVGYLLKQLYLLSYGVTLALTNPFQTPTILENQTQHPSAVLVLGMMQEKDMNLITQNLDESVEGAGVINCLNATTTLS